MRKHNKYYRNLEIFCVLKSNSCGIHTEGSRGLSPPKSLFPPIATTTYFLIENVEDLIEVDRG